MGYSQPIAFTLRCHPWNLIRLIPAKGVRRPRLLRASARFLPLDYGAIAMASPTKPPRQQRTTRRSPVPRAREVATSSWPDAFPNSTKVYVEGARGVRVPVREIALSGGVPPLRVYDTSGPQGFDVREGLPAVRGEWIRARDVGGALESLRGGNAPEAIQRVPRAHDKIASVAEPALSAVEGLGMTWVTPWLTALTPFADPWPSRVPHRPGSGPSKHLLPRSQQSPSG
jgi:hypothetical protein